MNRCLANRAGFFLAALTLCACEKKHDDDWDAPVLPAASTKPLQAVTTTPLRQETRANMPAMATEDATAKDGLKEADPDMREVLEQLSALGGKPIASLTPELARKQPTPADAAKQLLLVNNRPIAPREMAKVEDRKIPGTAGRIDARIYTPKTESSDPLPVIAYWHGGGFVIADLNTYDATPRALADLADAIVVSLDYRRAPEFKFPAAHDDAVAGYQWVLKNAASLGGDPKRIAVAGESAGGNLAANVAIAARDKNMQRPVHQLLVYPIAQSSMDTEAYQVWEKAKPLDKSMMEWFMAQYTTQATDTKDPRISLVDANLVGLSPTTIINAEIDPLLSDGEQLRDKMRAADVEVSQRTYQGVTHEFFGMDAVVSDAKDAQEWAAYRLKQAFEKK